MKSSELIARAGKVGGRIQLNNIILLESRSGQSSLDRPPNMHVDLSVTSGAQRDGGDVVCQVRYDVSVLSDEDNSEVFRIGCAWMLQYALPADSDDIDQLDVEAFAVVSSVAHAHPYTREFVSRLSGSMGFEPLFLDVLRPPNEIDAGEPFEVTLIGEKVPQRPTRSAPAPTRSAPAPTKKATSSRPSRNKPKS